MVGRKKKTKVSQGEDRISQLPDDLICDNILCHLSTKDAVRTSALSTRWRNLWRWVPGLDLGAYEFSNLDAFVRFVERFFDSQRESRIRKLRLSLGDRDVDGMCDLTSWIDAVTTRRIQHLDVNGYCSTIMKEIPLSIYTCKTLVHLQLCLVTLCNAEFVSLPCLKIMVLQGNSYSNETILQKLISGSPVLEDLTIITNDDKANVLQVRSHTLKRVYIDERTQVVIDAPLLQYLSVTVSSTKNFQIVNLAFSAKLVIRFPYFGPATYSSNLIHGILTDIARVRELVISNHIWKEIFQYLKSGPVLQFHNLSCLNAKFLKTDLVMLPTILESCPKLESFVLELVSDRSIRRNKKSKEPKVMFSTVPRCLVTSLKFVEWKRSISGYEGEAELVRYFLKNSTILEKLRLDVYYIEKAKCDFLKEVLTMPRCSSLCEIHCSFIAKDRYA